MFMRQCLDGVDVVEMLALSERVAEFLSLLDAGRVAADFSSSAFEDFQNVRNSIPGARNVEEDGVGALLLLPGQEAVTRERFGLIVESQMFVGFVVEIQNFRAHVSPSGNDDVGETVARELDAGLLRTDFVEVEGEDLAARRDGAGQRVGEGAGSCARLGDRFARAQTELGDDDGDVGLDDDLRAVRQGLRPELGSEFEDSEEGRRDHADVLVVAVAADDAGSVFLSDETVVRPESFARRVFLTFGDDQWLERILISSPNDNFIAVIDEIRHFKKEN